MPLLTLGAISLGITAASGLTKLISNHSRRKEKRARGRRIARQHMTSAGDVRDQATDYIDDLRRDAQTAIGSVQHQYAAAGGRVRETEAQVGTGDVDIGTFDREAYMRDHAWKKISGLKRGYNYDELSDPMKRAIRNVTDKAETSWGKKLRDAELPDLEADATRRARETGGSLMHLQNESLAAVERDILRVVTSARREMSTQYSHAAEARKSGESPGAFFEDLSTILDTASDMFGTYTYWKSLKPG